MKCFKSKIQLTALVLSFAFTNAALAVEPATKESKDNSATPVAQADSTASDQAKTVSDNQDYRKEMDERRSQAQKAQQESYERYLERKKQHTAEFNKNIPADVLERRNQVIKQMEERRALHVKMMEQHRKEADDRREAMKVKMHQTNTVAEPAEKA